LKIDKGKVKFEMVTLRVAASVWLLFEAIPEDVEPGTVLFPHKEEVCWLGPGD
jgi:hypothetical protein